MNEPSSDLDARAHAVIGAAIEVHSVLGAGFLESTYEQALAIELGMRRIPFQRQWPISLSYKGQAVGEARLDFPVDDRLIVELYGSPHPPRTSDQLPEGDTPSTRTIDQLQC
jgi:very-short-patch-repair endonuclease